MHNAEVYLHRPPKDRNDWHVRFAGPAIKIFNKMRASVSTGQNSAQNGSVASLGVLSAGKKGGPAVSALPLDFCLATSCTLTGEGRPADREWTKPRFIALCQFMLNGNGEHDFLHVYRGADDQSHFAKAKNARVDRRITWA